MLLNRPTSTFLFSSLMDRSRGSNFSLRGVLPNPIVMLCDSVFAVCWTTTCYGVLYRTWCLICLRRSGRPSRSTRRQRKVRTNISFFVFSVSNWNWIWMRNTQFLCSIELARMVYVSVCASLDISNIKITKTLTFRVKKWRNKKLALLMKYVRLTDFLKMDVLRSSIHA